MQTNDFLLEADNMCRDHFILDRYEFPLCIFYHRYLPQNLIKIQLIVSKAKRVHANYALLYALYTDYIKITSCVCYHPNNSFPQTRQLAYLQMVAMHRVTKDNKPTFIF
jgi:hypothetical protein